MTPPTFAEARRALQRGETSVEALVQSALDAVAARDGRINAVLHLDAEGALERARGLDRRPAGAALPPLAGLVLGVKDVLCVRGQPVTCGSRMLETFRALYDATAVARLQAAGAVSIGKLNCDEFAMGSTNETSHAGPVCNPLDEALVPGGSSGGSAAAVAAGYCHAALGSDTGGSVRQPAAFTGTVGLKPTYGRVSRFGLVAFASSFDTVGVLARSVGDAAAVLHAMSGADPNDATSAPVPVPDYAAALTGDVRGLRVGVPNEYFGEGLDPDVRRVVETEIARLEGAGAEIRPIALPHTRYGVATYYVLATAEASSNLARYDGVRYGHRADLPALRQALADERQALEAALAEAEATGDDAALAAAQAAADGQDSLLARFYTANRTEGFGAEVKRRIMLGTYVLSAGYYDAYYGQAQRARALVRRDFDRAFEAVDILVGPAAPTMPWGLGEKVDDPLAMYLGDVYTVPANLAGIPGLVVPARERHPGGLPVGVQLLGRPFDEATLLRAGDWLMRG